MISSWENELINIRLCFLEGFFLNIAWLIKGDTYCTLKKRKIVEIHPSSFAYRKKHQYICYVEIVLT